MGFRAPNPKLGLIETVTTLSAYTLLNQAITISGTWPNYVKTKDEFITWRPDDCISLSNILPWRPVQVSNIYSGLFTSPTSDRSIVGSIFAVRSSSINRKKLKNEAAVVPSGSSLRSKLSFTEDRVDFLFTVSIV